MVTTENTENTEIGTEKLNSFFMISIVGAVCSVVSVLLSVRTLFSWQVFHAALSISCWVVAAEAARIAVVTLRPLAVSM